MSWGNFYEQMKFHMMQHDLFLLQGFCDDFSCDTVPLRFFLFFLFFSRENRMQWNESGKKNI